jgi:hypothetical protein
MAVTRALVVITAIEVRFGPSDSTGLEEELPPDSLA